MKAKIEYAPSEKLDFSNTYKVTYTNLSNQSWEVKHKYSKFKSLYEFIVVSAPLFVTADFPKNYRSLTTSLLSGADHAESRRLGLEIWLNEVLANYEIFPDYSIRAEIDAFVKSPNNFGVGSVNPTIALQGNASRHMQGVQSACFTSPVAMSPSHYRPHQRNISVSENSVPITSQPCQYLESARLYFEQIAGRRSTNVTCISRAERIILSRPSSLLLDSILEIYKRRWCLTSLLALQFMLKSFNVVDIVAAFLCFTFLFVQLMCVESVKSQNYRIRNIPSYLTVKIYLRQIYGAKKFSYMDVSDMLPEEDLLLEIRRDSARKRSVSGVGSHSSACIADSISTVSVTRTSPSHLQLTPGQTFDRFAFQDLSLAAKGMFSDRGTAHAFKVRGLKYTEDKQKVEPGSAMCKLVLMELYEVEPTVRNRNGCLI